MLGEARTRGDPDMRPRSACGAPVQGRGGREAWRAVPVAWRAGLRQRVPLVRVRRLGGEVDVREQVGGADVGNGDALELPGGVLV